MDSTDRNKILILVRHAKSSWADPYLDDHDRPLNDRGKRDAPIMGEFLASRIDSPEYWISSTAKRAKKTAFQFADAFGVSRKQIHRKQELFHASPYTMLSVIQETPEDHRSVILFAHNPGITMMANGYRGNEIVNVPTAGIVMIKLDAERWADIALYEGEVLDFYFPKMFGS